MAYIFDEVQDIKFSDNDQVDAFNRIRVSELTSLFESTLKHNNEPFIWDEITNGSGSITYDSSQKLVDISVSTTGDYAFRQTREYFQYKTGKSHIGAWGGVLGAQTTDVITYCGFIDDDNGIGFYMDDTYGFSIIFRTSASGSTVDTIIPQSNWNVDPLDGSGTSGVNIDPSKIQMFFIDFQWTGCGRIRCGVILDGKVHFCHYFQNANSGTGNALSTPSLPIRYYAESTGGSGKMVEQAAAVLVEGDYREEGVERSVDTGQTSVNVGDGANKPILNLRLDSTHTKAQFKPLNITILQTSSNTTLYYAVYIRTSLTNASWSSVGTNAITEYDTSATAFSGGIKVKSGYMPSKATNSLIIDFESIIPLTSDYNNNRDIVTVVVSGVGGTVPTFVSMSYKEIY